jgi:hypothetical protein
VNALFRRIVFGLIFGLIFSINLLIPAMAMAADAGKLLFASGEVIIERGSEKIISKALDTVLTGDLIATGKEGRTQIQFSDGGLFSLQPNTRFKVDEYQFNGDQQRGFFALLRGTVRTSSGAIGKKSPDDYKLQTPTATVGIRGTEYLAEQTVCDPQCSPGASAGLRVAVTQGRIAVSNSTGTIELPTGQSAFVPSPTSKPEPLNEPIRWSATQLNQSSQIAATALPPVSSAGSLDTLAEQKNSNLAATQLLGTQSSTAGVTGAANLTNSVIPKPQGAQPETGIKSEQTATSTAIAASVSEEADSGSSVTTKSDVDPTSIYPITPTGTTQSGIRSTGLVEPIQTTVTAAIEPRFNPMPVTTNPNSNTNGANSNNPVVTATSNNPGITPNAAPPSPPVVTPPVVTPPVVTPPVVTPPVVTPPVVTPPVVTPPVVTPPVVTPPVVTPPVVTPPIPVLTTGFVPTANMTVELRNLPIISSASTSTGLAQAEFDSQMRLSSIGLCPSTACLSRVTAKVVDFGADQYVAWGRWTQGIVAAEIFGTPIISELSSFEGIHYLIGVPSSSMPTSGSATYSLLGATQATSRDSELFTFTGNAAVVFAPKLGTKVGLDFKLQNKPDGLEFNVQTNGGLRDPNQSQLQMINLNRFQGVVLATTNITPQLCANSGCKVEISGGFFGEQQQRIGLGYLLRINGAEAKLQGVATFKKN